MEGNIWKFYLRHATGVRLIAPVRVLFLLHFITYAEIGAMEMAASASVSAEATFFGPCVVDESFMIDPDTPVCILEVEEPGDYTVSVERERIDRPTSAFISVRDHSPGNSCGRTDTR